MQASEAIARETPNWQHELASVIRQGSVLLEMLGLDAGQVGLSDSAAQQFQVRVTHSFVRRMRHGDPNDPLLLQVLATQHEEAQVPGFSADPVSEVASANPIPGVLQKYNGRVLLLVSSACAIHCRYCFRRHFPYEANRNSRPQWDDAVDFIANDCSIEEVIFSGGDPLVASDAQLAALVERLAKIPHVRRLRFHTRLPVVLPQRITPELLRSITDSRLRTAVVIHANHANEIDGEVHEGLKRLSDQGVTLLNQAVLLAGINDSVAAQSELGNALYDAGVLPYYLHMLDPVSGAAHFDVSEARAKQIHRDLQASLPGYLVPRLVKEEAGASGKTLMN